MKWKTVLLAVAASSAIAGAAFGWGAAGHRMIGEVAVMALPDSMPAFLRTPEAVADIGEYSREPDRWRGAGKVTDNDRTPAHFIDLDDEGKTLAGQTLDQLPATRSEFDASLRAKNIDPYTSGYLPYALVDSYQQLSKDFATWRILTYLGAKETDAKRKAWYIADAHRREALIKRDIGILSHYAGDASQPLHTSIHYNGWGNYPNPKSYTQEHIHSSFEGLFVSVNVSEVDIKANMPAYVPCPDPVMTCFNKRILASVAQVGTLYDIDKAGGYVNATPQAKTFVAGLLGAGAAGVRDAILDAWRDSSTIQVGYQAGVRMGTLDDFTSGKVPDPWLMMHGSD